MRRLSAHIEHPGAPGKTLCGKSPCAVAPCLECLARWAAMVQVHIQSTRRVDLAFCGAPLQGPKIFPVRLGHLDSLDGGLFERGRAVAAKRLARSRLATGTPVVYVTTVDARSIVHDVDGPSVVLHQACVLNFGRFLGRLGVADELLSRHVSDDPGDDE